MIEIGKIRCNRHVTGLGHAAAERGDCFVRSKRIGTVIVAIKTEIKGLFVKVDMNVEVCIRIQIYRARIGIAAVGGKNGVFAVVEKNLHDRRAVFIGEHEECAVLTVNTHAEFHIEHTVAHRHEFADEIRFVFIGIIRQHIRCSAVFIGRVQNADQIPVARNAAQMRMTELFIVHEELGFAGHGKRISVKCRNIRHKIFLYAVVLVGNAVDDGCRFTSLNAVIRRKDAVAVVAHDNACVIQLGYGRIIRCVLRHIRNPCNAVDHGIFRRRESRRKNHRHLCTRCGRVIIGVGVFLDNAVFYGVFHIRRVPCGTVCRSEIVVRRAIGVVGTSRQRDGFGNGHAAVRVEQRIALAVDKAKLIGVGNFLGIPFGFRNVGEVAVIGVRL